MNIAFLGLGVMGGPMCANLLDHGEFNIRVYDIDPAKVEKLVEAGAQPVNSAREAVAGCELVMTSLPGPQQIDDAALGETGFLEAMDRGASWIDLSTNNLEVCRRVAERCRVLDVGFLDCPVSGGDEGAAAGTLAILAVLTKHEILLALVGGIFVLETLSVIIQVVSFKTTGKRVFAMAPIHHHYEKKGWSEPKIIVRFWIISIILALVALSTLKLR